MTPVNYDFGTYRKGDTLEETPFLVQRSTSGVISPVNITGCTITCMFKKRTTSPSALTITTSDYIVITSGRAGRFKINPVVLDMTAGLYYYDIQFYFPSTAETKTFIAGTIYIEPDISS